MATLDAPREAYRFFLAHYGSAEPFTVDELMEATGWTGNTPRTYVSKKWRELLERLPDGRYRVRLEFRRLTEEKFLQHFSQKTPLFTRYQRARYESLVAYEFLLPLAREPELRVMLDELFYSDALVNRLTEVPIADVERWQHRPEGATDDDLVKLAAIAVGEMIGGYSISHVNGRFRVQNLMTRAEAADLLKQYDRYLIDETTASVRFLLRAPSSRSLAFDTAGNPISEEEVERIREMFVSVFAEAVVRIVREEDEIWLIEESDYGRRLFVWEREARFAEDSGDA